MIAHFEIFHAFTHLHHDAGTLVTEDRRKRPLGVIAREGEGIGVAHPRRFNFHHHFACGRATDVDFGYFEGFARFKCDRSSTFHGDTPYCFRGA